MKEINVPNPIISVDDLGKFTIWGNRAKSVIIIPDAPYHPDDIQWGYDGDDFVNPICDTCCDEIDLDGGKIGYRETGEFYNEVRCATCAGVTDDTPDGYEEVFKDSALNIT